MQTLDNPLTGRRILVVEDDRRLAERLCNGLREKGATVLGPAPTAYYAYNLLLGRRTVDGAILDTRLYGLDVYDLAKLLNERGIPMVFAAEKGTEPHEPMFRNVPCLAKPIVIEDFIARLDEICAPTIPEPVLVRTRPMMASAAVADGAGQIGLSDRWYRAITRSMRG